MENYSTCVIVNSCTFDKSRESLKLDIFPYFHYYDVLYHSTKRNFQKSRPISFLWLCLLLCSSNLRRDKTEKEKIYDFGVIE